MVPTEVAFQDNHPRAKAVLPVKAPKTVDVPASYPMDSPAVHYHYHEAPVRMYEHEIPHQNQNAQQLQHEPMRMGCECSRESRKQHEAAILFWILTVVVMGLVIIGLIIALCCVSSKRTSYDYPMMSLLQQRYL